MKIWTILIALYGDVESRVLFPSQAEWERTETGRLSPKGRGRCTWEKTFRVPVNHERPDGKLHVKNTHAIWRNDQHEPCPVGQRI